MADSESDLLAYAKRLGMQERWIQKRGTAGIHFDVMGARLTQVLADPAVNRMTRREMAAMIRSRRTSRNGKAAGPCVPTQDGIGMRQAAMKGQE